MRLGDCDADCCLVDGLLRGKGVEDRDVAEEVGGDEGWEGQRTGDGEPVGEAVLEDGADDGNADGEAEGAEEGVPGGCMLGGTDVEYGELQDEMCVGNMAGTTYMPAAFPTSSAATCACIAITPAMRIMPCRRCQLLVMRRVSALDTSLSRHARTCCSSSD